MSRTAWHFYDPHTTEEYFWPVNPNTDSGSHAQNKSTNYIVSAGFYENSSNEHNIAELINVQSVDQSVFSYDGNVYTLDQLNALDYWSSKDHELELTDDLGRTFLIYVTKFSYSRVRSRQFPYKHSYNISGIILEEI